MTKWLAYASGFFRSSSSVRLVNKPPADPEPVYSDGRPMTGLFAHLTPEQQARALSYKGPEGVAATTPPKRSAAA